MLRFDESQITVKSGRRSLTEAGKESKVAVFQHANIDSRQSSNYLEYKANTFYPFRITTCGRRSSAVYFIQPNHHQPGHCPALGGHHWPGKRLGCPGTETRGTDRWHSNLCPGRTAWWHFCRAGPGNHHLGFSRDADERCRDW